MTSALLTVKLLGGVSAVGGAAAAGTYFAVNIFTDKPGLFESGSPQGNNKNRPLRQSTKTHTIVVAGATLMGDAASATNLENYQCQLSASNDTASTCKVTQLTFTKGWIDLGGIKKATQTAVIPKADLVDTSNYFKLEVDENFYDKVQIKPTKTIDVLSTTETQKKFGNLTVLFKFVGKDVDFENTKYLLGKANTGTTAPASGETYTCLPSTQPTANHYGNCEFYPFGSTTASLSGAGYSNQDASSLLGTPASSPLTENNYYLIQYSLDLVKTKATASGVVNVQASTPAPATAKGSFKDVVPVILHGADGSKKAFILSEIPAYSVVVQKTDAIADSKTLTHDQKTKNYQCKLTSSTPVNCNLVPLPFDSSSKTSLTLDAVKSAALTTDLSITTSDTKPAFFRLDVDETFFTDFSSGDISTKTIDVVELISGSAQSTPLFTLNPLFSIGNADTLHFDSSTFIIKSADLSGSDSSSGTLTTNKTRFCSFSDTDKGGSSAKPCSLIDLGATLDQTQNFTSTAVENAVETSKTYLVKFTSPNEKGLPKDSKGSNTFFIFEEGDDQTTAKRKQVAKFLPTNVEPAIIVEGASPTQFAFRLA